ncbi:MAG: hypothetical protein ACI9Y1_000241 [Lentisphaeria bacterium]
MQGSPLFHRLLSQFPGFNFVSGKLTPAAIIGLFYAEIQDMNCLARNDKKLSAPKEVPTFLIGLQIERKVYVGLTELCIGSKPTNKSTL